MAELPGDEVLHREQLRLLEVHTEGLVLLVEGLFELEQQRVVGGGGRLRLVVDDREDACGGGGGRGGEGGGDDDGRDGDTGVDDSTAGAKSHNKPKENDDDGVFLLDRSTMKSNAVELAQRMDSMMDRRGKRAARRARRPSRGGKRKVAMKRRAD